MRLIRGPSFAAVVEFKFDIAISTPASCGATIISGADGSQLIC